MLSGFVFLPELWPLLQLRKLLDVEFAVMLKKMKQTISRKEKINFLIAQLCQVIQMLVDILSHTLFTTDIYFWNCLWYKATDIIATTLEQHKSW